MKHRSTSFNGVVVIKEIQPPDNYVWKARKHERVGMCGDIKRAKKRRKEPEEN